MRKIITDRIIARKQDLEKALNHYRLATQSLTFYLAAMHDNGYISVNRFMMEAQSVASDIEKINILKAEIFELETLLPLIKD